jgi:hypothetical protein
MDNLTIEHNTHSIFRKITGAVSLLCGIIYFIIIFSDPTPVHLILAITWTLVGVLNFITAFGATSSTVQTGDGLMTVKWLNWMKSKKIQDSEIEKITITRFNILIDRKEKKQVKLPVDFFELSQKREAYTYFIELSKEKNYNLEKVGFGKE